MRCAPFELGEGATEKIGNCSEPAAQFFRSGSFDVQFLISSPWFLADVSDRGPGLVAAHPNGLLHALEQMIRSKQLLDASALDRIPCPCRFEPGDRKVDGGRVACVDGIAEDL